MNYKQISSFQNPLVKNLLLLMEKSAERKKQEKFVVEGKREVLLAINAGYFVEQLVFCPDLIDPKEIRLLVEKMGRQPETIETTQQVFNKVVVRDNSGGLIAVVKSKYIILDALELKPNPLLVVLETVEKPGNLGAILRTCDAAKVDALLVCDQQTDIFNPNVIRSSLGGIFTNKVVVCKSGEAIEWLKKNSIPVFVTHLEASQPYHNEDYTQGAAIVFGSEAFGVSRQWIEAASKRIIIPMQGKIDSLNVSASAAILIFEAARQKNFQ